MRGEANPALDSPACDPDRPKVVVKKRKLLRLLADEAEPKLVENDDEEDIARSRLQRVAEEATKYTNSPNVSPERRKSLTANSGLSHAQIAEHITNCLKLNAENKITPKNAFNLHLIDMMGSLLNKETNFQTAGSTLDASAKIYSYRVDSVHQETYKIAGGLGRTDKHAKQHGNEDDVNVDTGNVEQIPNEKLLSPVAPKKRKKKITKGSCIETNEKSINITGHEVKFENDELFENVRSSFDEGSALGLFSNTLQTINDSNRLILHSLCDLPVTGKLSSVIIDVADLFGDLKLECNLSCCPPLEDFEFLNWKADNEAMDSRSVRRPEFAARLDLSLAEAGSSATVEANPGASGHNNKYSPPGFGIEEEMPDDDVDAGSEGSYGNINDIVPKFPSLELVATALSTKELEYSYFDPTLVSTWQGPNHWKAKLIKKEQISDTDSEENAPKKKRQKPVVAKKDREDLRVDLDEDDLPLAAVFRLAKSKESVTLAKSTLEKYSIDNHLLDKDMEYKPNSFKHLFSKPDFLIKPKSSSSDIVVCDGNSVGYDVNNSIDKNNFCSDINLNNDDYADNDKDGGARDDDEDDVGVDDVSFGEVPDYEKVVDGNSGGEMLLNGDAPSTSDGAVLDDENVLKQPYKVNKIDINYAKQAKRIDVRRVKQCIWQVLTRNQKNSESPDLPAKLTAKMNLSTLCAELPKIITSQVAENLSVHTTLTILLHMCNEKNLSLDGTSEFGDIKISQG